MTNKKPVEPREGGSKTVDPKKGSNQKVTEGNKNAS